MIRQLSLAATALLLAAPLATPAAAQQRTTGGRELDWRGRIPSGGTLRVFNTNGAVRVEPADGDEASARSETSGSAAERERVILEVIEGGDGVTICARREHERCTEDGVRGEGRGWSDRERAGRANLMVRLPRGVNLRASSGNGAVTVARAGADVHASSGNGDVRVEGAAGAVRASSGNGAVTVTDAGRGVTASSGNGRVVISTAEGPVKASSGNGSVDVRMQALRGGEDMEFTSGNGRVTVRLPATFNGTLDLSTGHGSAYSDFPVTVQGRLQPTRLRGTVGDGRGPTVRLRSGNGSVEVRKIEG